ncbi:MAG: HindVP family restriction endonuclease [Aphanizomenon sp.]|jgi:hypothetical protein|nr:MAG: hypothetical protein AN483_10420 [Aphanizomenon flos-aquae MDT14a]
MQPENLQVGLFGLNHSNRDFSQRESWGKNQYTIVYLAVSIAHEFENSRDKLLNYLQPVCSQIEDWSSIRQVLPFIPQIVDSLDTLISENIAIQQIWKTVCKTSKLYQNCLDIFVWSN